MAYIYWNLMAYIYWNLMAYIYWNLVAYIYWNLMAYICIITRRSWDSLLLISRPVISSMSC